MWYFVFVLKSGHLYGTHDDGILFGGEVRLKKVRSSPFKVQTTLKRASKDRLRG